MGLFDGGKIKRVKVLGVRTAVQSKMLTDVNYGVYSLLVEHENGKVEVIEVEYSKMVKYAEYIEW